MFQSFLNAALGDVPLMPVYYHPLLLDQSLPEPGKMLKHFSPPFTVSVRQLSVSSLGKTIILRNAVWLLINCSRGPYKGVLVSWETAMGFIMSTHLPPDFPPQQIHPHSTLEGILTVGMAVTDRQMGEGGGGIL